MAKSDKKEEEKSLPENENATQNVNLKEEDTTAKEETVEEKLKTVEDKLLRKMAEMENQRRRFEKERDEAFEFGGFSFAKESLALIDNLERAKASFLNNKEINENKDFPKMFEAFEILENDLIAIFKRNNIKQIVCLNKK